jgi:hypothetical protein
MLAGIHVTEAVSFIWVHLKKKSLSNTEELCVSENGEFYISNVQWHTYLTFSVLSVKSNYKRMENFRYVQ